ncbi:MAG TPA: chondroitinase-B domain-containing protein [Niabella sp.]|nr:chondroitinase-B domain-containing protein [Niabella sp.]HOZ95436.1 chondroitinase-B domain-containing protein [Niabella sp.]HQW14326.1 chondroitinase-B domain-containing protein [Niabella sp.]HQX18395.1 chondroitinase-B domain-containing protein [Niabella sp.]HQX40113.1 chondroitinase-B domain-containing protein [Niabella sp.]
MKFLLYFFALLFCGIHVFGADYYVGSNSEWYALAQKIDPGDNVLFKAGVYKDIKLIINASGTENKRIEIAAKEPGKVFFTGDVKVELRGSFITLNGIVFKDGNRDTTFWKPHGPGLVAIYGSCNRVTLCAFNNFDEAHSAWVTTSLDENGKAPVHCRIDHCSFTNKLTFDQVINLNNTPKKDTIGGPPMYHRIDHCFFSNPKKPGNAGGAIRIGYYRNDLGRCLVDSNVFERQDSEPEIITGKSQENIYFANTFLNCQGTLNFRHGDRQLAFNNFFISTDSLFGYGGMFVWGSRHIIANNYFSLQKTIASRGNAAICFNAGTRASEHALAFDCDLVNNVFFKVNGYAIHLNPLIENRTIFAHQTQQLLEFPQDLRFENNIFYDNLFPSYPFFKDDYPNLNRSLVWKNNNYFGATTGISLVAGLAKHSISIKQISKDFLLPYINEKTTVSRQENFEDIPGLKFQIQAIVNTGIVGRPLGMQDIIPSWMMTNMGTYYQNGKLEPKLKNQLKRITENSVQ